MASFAGMADAGNTSLELHVFHIFLIFLSRDLLWLAINHFFEVI